MSSFVILILGKMWLFWQSIHISLNSLVSPWQFPCLLRALWRLASAQKPLLIHTVVISASPMASSSTPFWRLLVPYLPPRPYLDGEHHPAAFQTTVLESHNHHALALAHHLHLLTHWPSPWSQRPSLTQASKLEPVAHCLWSFLPHLELGFCDSDPKLLLLLLFFFFLTCPVSFLLWIPGLSLSLLVVMLLPRSLQVYSCRQHLGSNLTSSIHFCSWTTKHTLNHDRHRTLYGQ